MAEPTDDSLDSIKPRRRDANERCPVCKSSAWVSGAYQPPPMFHAAHPYGPCQVLVEGERCGCEYGLSLDSSGHIRYMESQ